ncbi:MAG TPA: Rrf2 family transcriptional regulator [Rhodocyclaceae bacterium]|nr:Rrf2 family transcriptional regulator [Rhodocyclaceae bacterium]
MYITQHTDYALRVLIHVAANQDRPDTRITIAGISELFAISRSHLMKVVTKLVREGFLEGVRGKGGGLRLKQAAEQIRIGDVVSRMEPNMVLVECFEAEHGCILGPACSLKGVLNKALRAFLATLNEVTLADLARQPQTLKLMQVIAPPRAA